MKPEQHGEGKRPILHRALAALVACACRHPRAVLAAALILAAISATASTRIEYRTERSDLVSPRKDYQQRWQQYLKEFGDEDDIVVVLQGADPKEMRRAIETLAGRIRSQPEHFDRLFYKVDLQHLRERALMFLPLAQIAQIQENLGSMKQLLDWGPIGWRALTVYRLLHEACDRVGKLKPGQELSQADQTFLTQLASITKSAAATLSDPAGYHNPWNSLMASPPPQTDLLAEPQYFFSGDDTLAFLLTRPLKEAGSFTGCGKSVEAVRAIVADTRPEFPGLKFGLTGLPVLETDEMFAAQRDTRTASWLAIVGVSVLFLIVYRSVYYPMLTVGTLLIGTSWALGWMTVTVGHLNILSATFALMLIGMGDYGVLWVMRYEQERRRGASVEEALDRTAVCVGAGTLTAALTTALAFFAAMLADFQGVAELGWIAGSGVLLCAFACFSVLPALLKLFDRRVFVEPATIPFPTRTAWLPGLRGQARWVVAGSLGLTALAVYWLGHIDYDHNLLHLQARNLDSVKWELTLIEHTAGASWRALSYTSTPEEALALKARYEKLPEVSRVVEVASLVPGDQEKKFGHLRDIQHRLRWLPERNAPIPHDLPDVGGLRKEAGTLAATLQPLVGGEAPKLLAELDANLRDFAAGLTADKALELKRFEERMAGDLAADLYRLRDVSHPGRITLDDLPPALRARFLGSTGKWLLQIFGKDCLWDFEPLEHFANQIHQVDPEATGKPFATVEGLKAMKSGFQWAGVYAFAAIVLILLGDFRNVSRTLVALAPLAMGIAVAMGVMGLFGLPLNPANMIALPLILGVGVDNGVHVLHDYLARKAEGRHVLSRAIGRGVLVKALTTMIGFGTLMISNQRGLAGLGFFLTLGVACCMVASLVFLPALLHVLTARRAPAAVPAVEIQPAGQAA